VNLSDFYSYSGVAFFTVRCSNLKSKRGNRTSSQKEKQRRSNLKSKRENLLSKDATLRINLNLHGSPIESKSHTHPSHSQTSCLLTSSLSLGVPVP
jgi:hypothetical protein